MPAGLDSVTLENVGNYFRKVRHYMFGYLLGVAAGPELEEHVKKCKKSMPPTDVSVLMSNFRIKRHNFLLIHLL